MVTVKPGIVGARGGWEEGGDVDDLNPRLSIARAYASSCGARSARVSAHGAVCCGFQACA